MKIICSEMVINQMIGLFSTHKFKLTGSYIKKPVQSCCCNVACDCEIKARPPCLEV